jgi:hypothetical protein
VGEPACPVNCTGVVCDLPPAAFCDDFYSLITFLESGECAFARGCEYESRSEDCFPGRCVEGACVPPEDCAIAGDEDLDGRSDCADSDCTNVDVCYTGPLDACLNPADLAISIALDDPDYWAGTGFCFEECEFDSDVDCYIDCLTEIFGLTPACTSCERLTVRLEDGPRLEFDGSRERHAELCRGYVPDERPQPEECYSSRDDDYNGAADCDDPVCADEGVCAECSNPVEYCAGYNQRPYCADRFIGGVWARVAVTELSEIVTCSADGSCYFGEEVTNCSSSGLVCVNGACGIAEVCDNGTDDDNDGYTDCDDSYCAEDDACFRSTCSAARCVAPTGSVCSDDSVLASFGFIDTGDLITFSPGSGTCYDDVVCLYEIATIVNCPFGCRNRACVLPP